MSKHRLFSRLPWLSLGLSKSFRSAVIFYIRKVSTPFGQDQIILLGGKGMCVWTTRYATSKTDSNQNCDILITSPMP